MFTSTHDGTGLVDHTPPVHPPGAPGGGEEGAVLLAAAIMQTQAGVHLLPGEVVNPLVLCSTITEESKDRQISLKLASAVVLWCHLNGSQSAPLTTPG